MEIETEGSHTHEQHQHTWFRQAEIANMWTHLTAFIIGLIAFHALMRKSFATDNTTIITAAGIYGLCVLFTFLASTLYHAVTEPRLKEIFHLMDHLLIYLMIAGTYTPFALILLPGFWGHVLFVTIWGLAIFGIIFKIFMLGKMRLLSTILYLFMGWIGVIAIVPIMSALPHAGVMWMLGGGIIYTLGVLFFMLESVPFAHTIWHLFVILGAAFQFICIYNYIIPNH